MEPLAIALSRAGRRLQSRGDDGGNLTNVQYKAIWNWHYESLLYNEYMLIKMKKKIGVEEQIFTKNAVEFSLWEASHKFSLGV
jgi:hypothetical protein